ncbi:MAG: FG-GAP-like repeat-containing protein, partial [Planctomycetota bacterium]
ISGGFDGRVYRWARSDAARVGPRLVVTKLTHAAFKEMPHVAPHAVDWDGDGDLDLLVGARNGDIFLCANRGRGVFGKPVLLRVDARTAVTADGGDGGPHAADWDGDGDLDLLVGGDFGSVRLFVNQGTRQRPALAPAAELIPRKGGRHATPACRTREHCARRAKPWAVDWNGDGRLDLLVGDMHDHRTPKDRENERLTGWVWLYLRTAR